VTKHNSSEGPIRAGLIALGCAKNLVDAEIMLGALLQDGVEITNQTAQADVLIVNTCSFIDAAQEESVDAILESAELRDARNRGQAIVVAGCLPQRFHAELPALLPEVDAFMGIDQVTQAGEIVRQAMARRAEKVRSEKAEVRSVRSRVAASLTALERSKAASEGEVRRQERALLSVSTRPTYIPDYATPRFRLTPGHFAYVKIAEGCNHPCSFCIIPRMRGSHRSRSPSDIVQEARRLIAEGVRELNLISQDSTYYGLDLRQNHSVAIASPPKFASAVKKLPAGGATICTLLRELNSLPGEFWIRLLYTHPAHWTDELIQTIADCQKVARYVDIPLQHIHENMLERMRRETSREYIVELIRRIRAGVPGIALRTTFIVGFPGETEACFQSLLDFIRDTKFERLGVFAYSREAGTRAGNMSGQIPDKIKQQRRKRAMAEQLRIARRVSESFVGRTLKVLVEGDASTEQLKNASASSRKQGFFCELETSHASPANCHYVVARGEADAPDIDGRILIRGKLPVGEFARVEVIGHTDYDLIAQPV
jgi:ribosomal protein S12 methylthiotransferase